MKHLDVVQPEHLFGYACPENVAEMPESGAGHFCSSCKKVVIDQSCATFEQAVDTVRNATPATCISYALDRGGELVFRDRCHGVKLVTVAAFLAACSAPAPEAKQPLAPQHDALAVEATQSQAAEPPAAEPQAAEPQAEQQVATTPPAAYPQDQNASWPSAVAPAVTKPAQPKVPVTLPVRPPEPPRRLAGAAPPRPKPIAPEPEPPEIDPNDFL